jgi:hypothetical protein
MSPQVIIAFIILLAGFGSAWELQSLRADSKEKAHVEQKLAAVQFSAAADIRRLDNHIEAQNKAVERERVLRRDADLLRGAVVSLSVSSSEALRAAQADHTTCIDRTVAFADVLQQCSGRYEAVVEKADRHASDVRTLIDAWPKP